jgi:Flp pilus assembly protein TadG
MVMLYSYPRMSLQEERRGSHRGLRVLAVLILSPLLALAGFGVDVVRGSVAQARLARAVDAAALAGGRVFFDSQRNSHIQSFFETTFPPGFLGTVPVDLDIIVDQEGGTLTVTGQTTMHRYFFDLVGDGELPLQAASKIRRSSRNTEPQLERLS